ncbi:unnamed protein product [Somion occarium]|uniref:YDG domain-containing protein n=1 Tax=Somion occarium TaxID=3059160 RepID=A0ABP1E8M9_9APHY
MKVDPMFGHIPGIEVGTTWKSRKECSDSGVHVGILQGIYGSQSEGAYSIALSGQYIDDDDKGETFIYTGTGGREKTNQAGKRIRLGPQTLDQSFDHPHNKALLISSVTKKPVRVIRGFQGKSKYAPAEGYRYDGLYVVEEARTEVGITGHKVCRFLFRRLPGQPEIQTLEYCLNLNNRPKSKRARASTTTTTTTTPTVRVRPTTGNSKLARIRKQMAARQAVNLDRLKHIQSLQNAQSSNAPAEKDHALQAGRRPLYPGPSVPELRPPPPLEFHPLSTDNDPASHSPSSVIAESSGGRGRMRRISIPQRTRPLLIGLRPVVKSIERDPRLTSSASASTSQNSSSRPSPKVDIKPVLDHRSSSPSSVSLPTPGSASLETEAPWKTHQFGLKREVSVKEVDDDGDVKMEPDVSIW